MSARAMLLERPRGIAGFQGDSEAGEVNEVLSIVAGIVVFLFTQPKIHQILIYCCFINILQQPSGFTYHGVQPALNEQPAGFALLYMQIKIATAAST